MPVESEDGKRQKRPNPVDLEVRLKIGNLDIAEVCGLRNVSRAQFYEDAKSGLVTIRKAGRKSYVHGPDAQAYITGPAA